MKSKANIPRNEDNLQGILVSRAYTASPEDQINLFNYNDLHLNSEKNIFAKSENSCQDIPHSSDTSKETNEGGGAPQLDQQTECIDTQISISPSESEPVRSIRR